MTHSHQRSFLSSTLLIACMFVGLTANTFNHFEIVTAAPLHQSPAPAVSESSSPQAATGTLSYTVSVPLVIRARTTCLEAPKLISPQNGALLTTIAPTYTIQIASTPVTHTIIEIANNPLFTSRAVSYLVYGSANATRSTRGLSNLKVGTTYYWRAYSVCGNNTSDFTSVYSFTTASNGVVLPAPTLLSPANNVSGVGSALTLSWTPVPGADSYRVTFGPASSINNLSAIATQPSYKMMFLQPNTNYMWSVSALNEFGYGTESEKRYFTTGSFSQ